jgi:hypothetical protein
MKKFVRISAFVTVLVFSFWNTELAHATASTHIWAPSTDTQAWGTGHVTADVYIPSERNADGSRANTITNTGLPPKGPRIKFCIISLAPPLSKLYGIIRGTKTSIIAGDIKKEKIYT